jgi:hypothetical protein
MARSRRRKKANVAEAGRGFARSAVIGIGGIALLWLAVQADLHNVVGRMLMDQLKPAGPTNAGVIYEREMARQAAAKQGAE